MIAVLSSKLFFKSVLIINAFMVLLPVFFLFNSALRETNSFASNPFSLARDPHWENFQQVWSRFRNECQVTCYRGEAFELGV